MRTLAPLLCILVACSPTIDGKGVGDSGVATADGADGADGTDDSGATDGTEPVADTAVWEGTRTFMVDARYDDYDCDGDTVAETGVELTSGSVYDAMMAACPLCDHVYEVQVERDEACGWIELQTSVWRGLVLGEGSAQVYRFTEDGGRVELDALDLAATFDGFALGYQYVAAEEWWGQIDVTGQLTFPETSPATGPGAE